MMSVVLLMVAARTRSFSVHVTCRPPNEFLVIIPNRCFQSYHMLITYIIITMIMYIIPTDTQKKKKNSVKSSDMGIGIVVGIVLFISLGCVCMCAAACTSKSERTQTTTLPSSFENPNIVVSTIDLYRTFECTKEDPISKHTWHQGPPDVHSYLATDADTTAIIYSKS